MSTTYQDRPVYKVLGADGASTHGGALAWSLPVVTPDGSIAPGQWHDVDGAIACCDWGLHLTTEPVRWWQQGARVFAAEYDGDVDAESADSDKLAVRRARLLREEVDWQQFGVYASGEHSVASGRVWAFGSATVEASDRATVRAFDSATVEASDSATVEASDSATVQASDSATVRAFDSATVEASGSATVIRTPYHRGGWLVLKDFAGVVDRRAQRTGGVPVAQFAPWSDRVDGDGHGIISADVTG